LLKKQKEVIEFAPHETVSKDTSSGRTDIIDLS